MEEKKNYDSEFCGSLPLHLINLIQPYGVLLVLNKSDLKIIQVSENIESVTGLSPQKAVNTCISQYIPSEDFTALQQKLSKKVTGKIPLPTAFSYENTSVNFLALIHEREDYLIVEMEERKQLSHDSFVDVYQEIKIAMAEINAASSTKEVCHTAIQELKRLSAFDKIMVYRFDEQWNGEVIAEVMEEGMEPYMGLHFPASDVPKQARALYLKNPYRLIPTRDYAPVKIYPVINPNGNGFIDLSNCNLRSVAAVHLEYLKNMGVMASMSTAIIKNEQLWGLISCHHRQPKFLSYETCSVFELMAGIISNRVVSIQNQEQLHINSQAQTILTKLIEQVYLDDDPISGMTAYPVSILNLLECGGAVIAYDRKFKTIGTVPPNYEAKDLIFWLQQKDNEKVYSIENLSNEYDHADGFTDVGSGVIVLPIHVAKGEFIIGFRPEAIQKVNWGGNPNEAINFEKNSVVYHPRNSFNLWQQTVQHASLRWQKHVVDVAETFRNFLIEYTLKKVYSLM